MVISMKWRSIILVYCKIFTVFLFFGKVVVTIAKHLLLWCPSLLVCLVLFSIFFFLIQNVPVLLFCKMSTVLFFPKVPSYHLWVFNYQCDNSASRSETNKLKCMHSIATHLQDKVCIQINFFLGHPWGGRRCHSGISCNCHLQKPKCLSSTHLLKK